MLQKKLRLPDAVTINFIGVRLWTFAFASAGTGSPASGAESIVWLQCWSHRTRTKRSPWYLIPAIKKCFRDLAVSHIINFTLEEWA
jgi:hypothetical protein